MDGNTWGPVFFFLILGAVILTPIILRNRLLAKQLDALTVAMQQGIAPERLQESLMLRREEGDINGNWKAAQILIALGWAYLPFAVLGVLAAGANGGNHPEAIGALLPGVALLVIGYRLRSI